MPAQNGNRKRSAASALQEWKKLSERRSARLLGIGRRGAGRAFPLVAIHTEEEDPEVCFIGRVLGVTQRRLRLVEINTDATWESEPTEYRLDAITRVDFGGGYEDALHIVGGDPPGAKPRGR